MIRVIALQRPSHLPEFLSEPRDLVGGLLAEHHKSPRSLKNKSLSVAESLDNIVHSLALSLWWKGSDVRRLLPRLAQKFADGDSAGSDASEQRGSDPDGDDGHSAGAGAAPCGAFDEVICGHLTSPIMMIVYL
jgi:hypothetical protein